jgi:glutaminyl-tRNA synthetase
MSVEPTGDAPHDFIRSIITEDLAQGTYDGRVITRFPPEPNGYLHIGHAKSICLNFGVGEQFEGARCHMRFDDTNPTREDIEFVESILEDVHWLGFDWGEHLYYASDYFEELYQYAEQLILDGNAYVDSLTAQEIRDHRGTLTESGRASPYRDRPVEENLDLFRRMRAGGFPDGAHVLRARIDMDSPNVNMRDPVLYRIRHAEHHRTGNDWCIYPMYDYAHSLSDSIEGITHSLCTLEFEDHRPLYDWCQEVLGIYRSRQIEFARLSLSHTVMSKRMLRRLVEESHVAGWDDPRMPTLSALRRRGYTPEAIRDMCERVGVARRNTVTDLALLEHCLREDLNRRSPRRMAVLNPLKVVVTNYPEGQSEFFDAINNPEDPSMGVRKVPFTRELYIERDDFMEDPPRRFYRLAPGREVRLRYACLVTCTDVVKDAGGNIMEVHCTYDPDSRGGNAPDGRRVPGTIHWVSATHGMPLEVRLYENLFVDPAPAAAAAETGSDFTELLSLDSLSNVSAVAEPALADARPGDRYQFERLGYFCADAVDSQPQKPVFNRTVTLRDSWARINRQQAQQ